MENPKAVRVEQKKDESVQDAMARSAIKPEINGALVIDAFQDFIPVDQLDMGALAETLAETCKIASNGDLRRLEAMLLSQATALQSTFTCLAVRASKQKHMDQFQTFMNLALKAQSQSRATISALVDLKHPKQALFVNQANIAHGAQQVNNGVVPVKSVAHAKKNEHQQNKLLEDKSHERPYLDTGATQKAKRSYQKLETLDEVDRAKKRRR